MLAPLLGELLEQGDGVGGNDRGLLLHGQIGGHVDGAVGRPRPPFDHLEQRRHALRHGPVEELEGPHVAGGHDQAGAGGVDDAAELLRHHVRVRVPRVLGPLLVATL